MPKRVKEGPMARISTCFGTLPLMMKPPIPTLFPVCTRIRVEKLTACAATGVGDAVGLGVGVVGVTVGVGVGVAGVTVGVGVGVIGVTVGVGVGVVGVTVGVGVGVLGVTVGVGVGVAGVTVGVGVGVGVAVEQLEIMMVSIRTPALPAATPPLSQATRHFSWMGCPLAAAGSLTVVVM